MMASLQHLAFQLFAIGSNHIFLHRPFGISRKEHGKIAKGQPAYYRFVIYIHLFLSLNSCCIFIYQALTRGNYLKGHTIAKIQHIPSLYLHLLSAIGLGSLKSVDKILAGRRNTVVNQLLHTILSNNLVSLANVVCMGMSHYQSVNMVNFQLLQLGQQLSVFLALFAILIVFIITGVNENIFSTSLNQHCIPLANIQHTNG